MTNIKRVIKREKIHPRIRTLKEPKTLKARKFDLTDDERTILARGINYYTDNRDVSDLIKENRLITNDRDLKSIESAAAKLRTENEEQIRNSTSKQISKSKQEDLEYLKKEIAVLDKIFRQE